MFPTKKFMGETDLGGLGSDRSRERFVEKIWKFERTRKKLNAFQYTQMLAQILELTLNSLIRIAAGPIKCFQALKSKCRWRADLKILDVPYEWVEKQAAISKY